MALSLPADVVEVIGKNLDFATRKSCLLAHRSLAPTMYAHTFQDWELRNGQLFDKKFASLLKLKPRLSSLVLVVREEFDVARFVGALERFVPSSVGLVVKCGECDAAIGPLLRALSLRRRQDVQVYGTLQRFGTFVDIMEHCSDGWLRSTARNITIRNHVELDDAGVERIKRLARSWHDRRWTIDCVDIVPVYPNQNEIMADADAARSIRDLMTWCVKRINIHTWSPSLLSSVAHSVGCGAHLMNNAESVRLLEDLCNTPNLDTLILSRWDSRLVVDQRALFGRVMKNGRVKLQLDGHAVKDPSLGNVILATACKVELEVHDTLGAFVARRTVESLKSRIAPDRAKITYVGGREVQILADVPLDVLGAMVVNEEDPVVWTYFDV